MRNYLSFGGGVNSVAMYLYLLDEGWDFEAVFVNHGTDWPETYEYVEKFREKYPLTIIYPDVNGYKNLYDYCWEHKWVPSFMRRWCTDKFKIRPIMKYYRDKAKFQFIGFAADEAHRAKISIQKGIENRYPLIEAGITRADCKKIIKDHGLSVPMRSGCYICPFQRRTQWRELRVKHPDLFCKAEQLERRNIDYRIERGKPPLYLNQYPKATLSKVVQENQKQMFKRDEYPPCECML